MKCTSQRCETFRNSHGIQEKHQSSNGKTEWRLELNINNVRFFLFEKTPSKPEFCIWIKQILYIKLTKKNLQNTQNKTQKVGHQHNRLM